MRRQPKRIRPACECLEDRQLLSMITPAQLRHAYGMDSIAFGVNGQTIAGNGGGQTIAIVGAYHNPYLAAEVHAFDVTYGLSDPVLNQANLAGARVDAGWAEEEALDVEWAHTVAPGAAILVVEAQSEGLGDLMNAVNYARQQPGVSVVSMSWGSNEFPGQASYDAIFSTPAGHNGVTFVTATGDSGAAAGAQWPASSTHVVAVGGTSLTVDLPGNVLSETAWSGGGGGYSRIVAEPNYQRSVQGSGRRSTPDVAMVADPATGVPVYTISPYTGSGYWRVFGGTSLSAQLFGGLVAIANEGRQLQGVGTLDGPSQTLPALYAGAGNAYRDVTAGSNGNRAAAGYDLASGLGAPRGVWLVYDLATASTFPSAVTAAPARRRSRFARVRRAEVAGGGELGSRSTATAPLAVPGALHDLALERAARTGAGSRWSVAIHGRRSIKVGLD
jgi:subtilase family serine protease